MHPAAKLQFERMIDEYAHWRAVPPEDRSPAPAWWWGPAIELRNDPEQMPVEWCAVLGLPEHADYAAGVDIFVEAFEGQTSLPWPFDFPRKTSIPDAPIRELHPQPSDDSAFQP